MRLIKIIELWYFLPETKESIMNIKEYMFRQGLTTQSLAALMDCSTAQITLLRSGKRVSKKFARQVERVTKGLVSADEVINPPKLVPLPSPKPLYSDDQEDGKAA